MNNIEVELRSFITKSKYNQLRKFFEQKAKFIGAEKQITYYLSGKEDLRIQKSDDYAKVWLKKGKIHDKAREEIEIKFKQKDFNLMYKLFLNLGFTKIIEWRRQRRNYLWGKISVMIDYSVGYGYIIEMEMITDKKGKGETLSLLANKFKEIDVKITPKEEFNRRFLDYKKNWRKLLNNKQIMEMEWL